MRYPSICAMEPSRRKGRNSDMSGLISGMKAQGPPRRTAVTSSLSQELDEAWKMIRASLESDRLLERLVKSTGSRMISSSSPVLRRRRSSFSTVYMFEAAISSSGKRYSLSCYQADKYAVVDQLKACSSRKSTGTSGKLLSINPSRLTSSECQS